MLAPTSAADDDKGQFSSCGACSEHGPGQGSAPSLGIAEDVSASGASAEAAFRSSKASVMLAGTDNKEFTVTLEILYHAARQRFLAAAHRWAMFGVILMGTGATVNVAPAICGIMAALIGAADIAFDFSGRSQAHADIRRRYHNVAARIAAGEFADNDAAFAAEWLDISADEPPAYRTVQKIAYEQACDALKLPLKDRLPSWKKLLAHFWAG